MKPTRFDPALLDQRPVLAVMGILNITPDSFSDGGRFNAPELALAQARRMIDDGAESSRPGTAMPVRAEEERKRLAPAAIAPSVPVSTDSMKARVVASAVERGAAIVNDVRGLQGDIAIRIYWLTGTMGSPW